MCEEEQRQQTQSKVGKAACRPTLLLTTELHFRNFSGSLTSRTVN